jgi:hypothetical protein
MGLYREFQSHSNREINPEWVDAYAKITAIAEKMEIE